MNEVLEFFKFLLNSEDIIRVGGLTVITLIVFAETGLFFCFFLPGDYLLFLAGLFCAAGTLPVPVTLLAGAICIAAIVGNYTGYAFGRSVGPRLYQKKDSLFFKKKYMENTKDVFTKYGGKALVIGRFLPIVRTFAPILAGTSGMELATFSLYNLIGAVLWSGVLVFGGYFLGGQFPQLIDYVHYIILGFLGFTTLTLIRSYIKIRQDQKKKEAEKMKVEELEKR